MAPEWDRKIARVAELMQASQIGRLAVALPLPGGCYSEVALARMIALDGRVSLVDTQAPRRDAASACAGQCMGRACGVARRAAAPSFAAGSCNNNSCARGAVEMPRSRSIRIVSSSTACWVRRYRP